jgi:hypothetical protein
MDVTAVSVSQRSATGTLRLCFIQRQWLANARVSRVRESCWLGNPAGDRPSAARQMGCLPADLAISGDSAPDR